MALTVEDGTGLADAESYITTDWADTYHANRAQETWADGTDDDKEAALRRAVAYLDGRYGPRFTGLRLNGRDQALMWPRVGATDTEGWAIASDVIPVEIMRAQAECAIRELDTPGFLSPDVATTGAVQRIKKKVGPIETETEYALGGSTTGGTQERLRPFLTVLDDLLMPLLGGGIGGSFGNIPVVRA